jgi:hypothetical protein
MAYWPSLDVEVRLLVTSTGYRCGCQDEGAGEGREEYLQSHVNQMEVLEREKVVLDTRLCILDLRVCHC